MWKNLNNYPKYGFIIGLLKKRYTILKGTLPISVIKHRDDIEEANIDKLILVCSALTNLGNPI